MKHKLVTEPQAEPHATELSAALRCTQVLKGFVSIGLCSLRLFILPTSQYHFVEVVVNVVWGARN